MVTNTFRAIMRAALVGAPDQLRITSWLFIGAVSLVVKAKWALLLGKRRGDYVEV